MKLLLVAVCGDVVSAFSGIPASTNLAYSSDGRSMSSSYASPPLPYTLGSQGVTGCSSGYSAITDATECNNALSALGISKSPAIFDGQVCYKDAQGYGYANGQNGGGAYYICKPGYAVPTMTTTDSEVETVEVFIDACEDWCVQECWETDDRCCSGLEDCAGCSFCGSTVVKTSKTTDASSRGGGSTMCPSDATPCCEVGSASCGGSPYDEVPKRVCIFDPSCCTNGWDQQCVNEANNGGYSCSDGSWKGAGNYCLEGNVAYCENAGEAAQLVENCGESGCTISEGDAGGNMLIPSPYGGGGGVDCPYGSNWYGEGNYCLDSNIYYCTNAGARTFQLIESCGFQGCASDGKYLQRTCDYTPPDATCTVEVVVPSGPQMLFVGRCASFSKIDGGRSFTIESCSVACSEEGSDRFFIDTNVEADNGVLGRCRCALDACDTNIVNDPSWTTYSV